MAYSKKKGSGKGNKVGSLDGTVSKIDLSKKGLKPGGDTVSKINLSKKGVK